jgi:hypothetical protein
MNTKTRTKTFKYLGQTFKPLRQFTKQEEVAGIFKLRLHSIGISNYDKKTMPNFSTISDKWDYDVFYEIAQSHEAGDIDIFLMNGEKEVVPCGNELFEFKGII